MELKVLLDTITGKLGLNTHRLLRLPLKSSFCLASFHLDVISIADHLTKQEEKDHLIHEIGHAFFSEYYGIAINKLQFRRLFGNPDERYYLTLWYLGFEDYTDWEESAEHISKYAQVHPQEDFAETFVEAWNCIQKKEEYDYGDKLLNRKVNFVKKAILKVMQD